MDVRIRSFVPEDAAELARLANNRLIFNNVRDIFPFPYTLEDAQAWIEFAISKRKPHGNQAIEVDGTIAGCVGAAPGQDIHRVSVEIGYWLGEPYWGQGIMTRAVQSWVEQVWVDLPQAHRLWAGVFSYNQPSMRVLEKAGFREEAILQQSVIKNGQLWDEHIYALVCR